MEVASCAVPKVKAKICVFHTKQALNRKVQAFGLMPSYIDDPVVSKIVRQIEALQLTPPEEWKKCLLLLEENYNKGRPLREMTVKDDSCWTVKPTPGFVVKFKDPRYLDLANQLKIGDKHEGFSSKKFFLNIAHCIELPSPKQDLDENEVAKLLGTEDCFKIPISLSDIDQAVDNQGEIVSKVDVLVNSTFFHKRIQTSEFFRQLLIMTVIQAVEARHEIMLDSTKQVILRNKKVIGELKPQRVKEKPNNKFEKTADKSNVQGVSTLSSVSGIEEVREVVHEPTTLILHEKSSLDSTRPRNYRVQILNGEQADIRIRIRDSNSELVNDVKRLTLKMNNDRCAVILDGSRVVADFFLPFYLLDEEAKCEFIAAVSTIIIKCPVNWRHQKFT
uniref:PIH1 N-terminal domain-containing protein n=1 Tax=Ditylenchus dipsaci TaxID=166011 RepID=A0A915E5Y9_9BILA